MFYLEEKPKFEKKKSFHNSFGFLLKFANWLGLLPLRDLSSVETIRYEWKSWKGFYALLLTLLFAGNITIAMRHWTTIRFSFRVLVKQLNQINAFISLILFFKLAKKWPKFAKLWNEVDQKMAAGYGFPKYFDLRIKLCSFLALLLSLTEYILLLIYYIHKVSIKQDFEIENYYRAAFTEFFSLLPFNAFTAFFATLMSLIGQLIWSFNDLFIVAVSTALALRFQQVTTRIYSDEKKTNSNNYWIEIRADYDRLVHLSRKLDKYVSYIVLLSYSANIFFLLIQLSNVIGHFKRQTQIIYYSYSFLFLLVRLTAVSLYGAWIIDESKEPANCLHSVPSGTYNLEIRRLLLQISFNDVGLTGNKMFTVTRSLLLHVAGAIVTYELVILQFNSSEGLQ